MKRNGFSTRDEMLSKAAESSLDDFGGRISHLGLSCTLPTLLIQLANSRILNPFPALVLPKKTIHC
jgi:hypothetical protein